jgi:hypothetical protein
MKSIGSGRLNPGTVPAIIYTAMGKTMKASVTVVHHPTEIATHHFPSTDLGQHHDISPFWIAIVQHIRTGPVI